jgi:hypothetical protein
MSHIQIAILVIAGVSLVGVILSVIRGSSTFSGYEDYKQEMMKVARSLHAEVFRDGDDVVLAGNHKKLPLQVRFSYSETTPGLNIRLQAPVSFTFSVVPKGAVATEGRVPVRTGDEMFDSRFIARTDHPTQAKMLVSNKVMRAQMAQLCCSSKTYLTLVTGSIEVSELVIPSPNTSHHILDHIEAMGVLATAVEAIPGADKVKITPYQREKSSPVVQVAIGVGAVAAIIAIFLFKPQSAQPDLSGVAAAMATAEGVAAVDMPQIPSAMDWHAAKTEDFDADVASWVKGGGGDGSGRVPLQLDPEDQQHRDVAYWLVKNGTPGNRLVVLQNGTSLYDAQYPDIVGIARIRFAEMANIDWRMKPAVDPSGDGVLLLRRTDAGTVGQVFFFKAQRMYTGTPKRYDQVSLQ